MPETLEEIREQQRARSRKWWAANSERMKAKKSTPEYKERRRQWRLAWLERPGVKARVRKANRLYQQTTRHSKKRSVVHLLCFQAYKQELTCSICGLLGGDAGHLLCFHHKDPKQKDFNLGLMAQGYWGTARFEAELTKCIPLCHNCHAHLHWELRQQAKLNRQPQVHSTDPQAEASLAGASKV